MYNRLQGHAPFQELGTEGYKRHTIVLVNSGKRRLPSPRAACLRGVCLEPDPVAVRRRPQNGQTRRTKPERRASAVEEGSLRSSCLALQPNDRDLRNLQG